MPATLFLAFKFFGSAESIICGLPAEHIWCTESPPEKRADGRWQADGRGEALGEQTQDGRREPGFRAPYQPPSPCQPSRRAALQAQRVLVSGAFLLQIVPVVRALSFSFPAI